MYLFQSGFAETPASFPGQAFDDFLVNTPSAKTPATASPAFLNPNELSIKRESQEEQTIRLDSMAARTARSPPSSEGSTRSSSSDDAKFNHNRNISAASGISPAATQGGDQLLWNTSGIGGFSMPSGDDMFADSSISGLENDFEASNEQMASDFDFETAASTPSGFDAASLQQTKPAPGMNVYRRTNFNTMGQNSGPSTRLPAGQPQFFFGASREASPLSAMLPTAQGQSPWSKNSPSSGLEETFNGITMNGDSPNHPTFNPAQFQTNGFSFEPESSATPSTFNKDISSPPSTINSTEGNPRLTVQPTSLKSRVETQIPIRLTLSYLPNGVTKLRLPTYTVSKPKFLAKPEVERNSEILELHVSLVCTSAMQENSRLDRAFARARGEELSPLGRPSPASSNGSHGSMDEEDKPLNGGEVRICAGCIQRERKRASRKKQKKPEEEEQFQKDEEKRIVVFNTNELKEWVEPSRDALNGSASPPPGAVQVELPMRIACYCRHQNEKLGFQVIFTIKDFKDKVIAQAMTNSIMITDDHKTHNAPPPPQQMPAPLPNAPALPGAGVFASGMEMPGNNPLQNSKFKTSFSTNDLHGLQPNFNQNYPMTPASNPFAVPSAISSTTSTTLTPRNLSRPVSPSGPSGPMTKRRKQSGSGKIPSGLTMTRLETNNASGSATMPNSAVSTPYANSMQSFIGPADHGYAIPAQGGIPRQQTFGTSPPTPNSNDNGFISGVNRSYSLENLSRSALISAPSSRQPSRPGSPGPRSARNSFGATDPNFGQSVTNQLMGQPSRRPPPLIHKLVPAEGSVTGGTDVTLLGTGFYQGLEVMFGDTEATTTTFWGEKCLNCIAPPALQPGTVTVMFKHEHHQYNQMQQQSQTRPSVFTYTDDREVEMYRLALKTLGKTMQHPTDDPYAAAQQLLGSQHNNQPWYWSQQGNFGGHQRQMVGSQTDSTDLLDLETNMLSMLQFMDASSGSKSSLFDMCRPTGATLLHLASSLGLTRFVVGLLARGARPDILDRGGNTPMHHAAMNGHTHIIHRLRLAGADNKIRSIRNYIPADLATSLLAHQAAMIPSQNYRSRSAGGTPLRLQSRSTSSASLRSFWENASMATTYTDESDSSEEEEPMNMPHVGLASQVDVPRSSRPSRRPSGVVSRDIAGNVGEVDAGDKPVTPMAYMMAWRNSLAAQINQFHESTQWTMPNLPTLPALPPIPDYQDYSMVRRVSSLFPQRPTSRPSDPVSKEGWWETLTGSPSPVANAPPAYNELYPHNKGTNEDYSMKKRGVLLAAVEAAADLHLSQQEAVAGPSTRVEPIRMYDGKPIKRVEFRQDQKLFFFWVSSAFLRILKLTLMGFTASCAHHHSRTYAAKHNSRRSALFHSRL
jgi:hypothetical protein